MAGFRRIVGALLSAAMFPAAGHAQSGIKVPGGLVSGVTKDAILSFKGVPFAAPPVGDLRWRAPQPVAPWQGVRHADHFGDDCMSMVDPKDQSPPTGKVSEDCLYLNIWRPAKLNGTGKLPVMVWIYGGGFVRGGTSPAVHDGSNLARQGVMLVSFNYRVSQFGYFAHPALAREQAGQPRGNYGFLDMIAAVRWVKENAASFGGDPDNITVFGVSSGGFGVDMMLLSPLSQGLFHKAIIQSGGGRQTVMYGQRMSDDGVQGRKSAEGKGLDWAHSLGIEGDGPDAARKLRALSAEEVLKAGSYFGPYYSSPMIDGIVQPTNMMTAFASGKYSHIPVMIGTTEREIGLSKATSKEELFHAFGDFTDEAKALYDPTGSADLAPVRETVAGDQFMHEPARYAARMLTAGGSPAWLYRFGYVATPKRADWPMAPHGSDVPYVLDTLHGTRFAKGVTAADDQIARTISGYWVAFAKTGNPNGGGRPEWKAFGDAPDSLLAVDKDGVRMTKDPWAKRLDLIEKTMNAKIVE